MLTIHQHVTDPGILLTWGSRLLSTKIVQGGSAYGRILFKPDPVVMVCPGPREMLPGLFTRVTISHCIFVYKT